MQSRSTPVHWYVIAKADADLPTLVRELESVGCRCDAPTALGHGEQMLEVMELGKPQPIEGSVEMLMNVVERWGASGSLEDDVSILGLEVT